MEGISKDAVSVSEVDHYVKFPNGSEIWVDGLDDKERVEKILGREYATVHLNEISQIPYNTVLMVLTRLAQKVTDLNGNHCINKAYYDLNPVGRAHWGYKLFVEKKDPFSGESIPNPNDYASMTLNPDDNVENLPEGYISDILDRLPENKRRRFRLGEWNDPEGVVFPNWRVVESVPDEVKRHSSVSYGLDFGFSVNPTALVRLFLLGDDLYIEELIYENELTNAALATRINKLKPTATIFADSAEPKSIRELQIAEIRIVGASKGPDSRRQGIDWLLGKNLFGTRGSVNVQSELMNYEWKTKNERVLPEPIDDYDHAIDAIRYGAEPFMRVRKVAGNALRTRKMAGGVGR